jgi:hypothetical protein
MWLPSFSKDIQLDILVFTTIIALLLSSIFFPACIADDGDENEIFDEDTLQHSLAKAEQWLIANLNEDGYFNYLYDPSSDTYSASNNMIRQLMASRVLAEMCHENATLEALHQKNLNYIFGHWYQEENETGYIFYSNKSKLGAMAMVLRTLIYSPFFDNYQDQVTKLANCILSLQHEGGSFEPWYIEPSYSYDADYLLTFYSGEALLSLVELYSKTKNNTYLNAVILSQDFYVERYVVDLVYNYYPAYVPWHTQSLNKLYQITGNQIYADAILILNDKLLELQDIDGPAEYFGRFYNESTPQYGSPHSSSDAVYTEGLAYAYEIAVLINDTEHQQKYKDAVILGAYNLINLQYTSPDERIDGAIRYHADDDRMRVDTTQHTIDAFNKILDVFESGWTYVVNANTTSLNEYHQEDTDDMIWYAACVGALLVVVILFLITKQKEKFKK